MIVSLGRVRAAMVLWNSSDSIVASKDKWREFKRRLSK